MENAVLTGVGQSKVDMVLNKCLQNRPVCRRKVIILVDMYMIALGLSTWTLFTMGRTVGTKIGKFVGSSRVGEQVMRDRDSALANMLHNSLESVVAVGATSWGSNGDGRRSTRDGAGQIRGPTAARRCLAANLFRTGGPG